MLGMRRVVGMGRVFVRVLLVDPRDAVIVVSVYRCRHGVFGRQPVGEGGSGGHAGSACAAGASLGGIMS